MNAVTSISVLIFLWKFFIVASLVVIANSVYNISNRADEYIDYITTPPNHIHSEEENNNDIESN